MNSDGDASSSPTSMTLAGSVAAKRSRFLEDPVSVSQKFPPSDRHSSCLARHVSTQICICEKNASDCGSLDGCLLHSSLLMGSSANTRYMSAGEAALGTTSM